MSDADSVLDSLMDDATGLSFVVLGGAEHASRTPSPAVPARSMGVVRSSKTQGTNSVGGKSYSVVLVTGSDRSICFGVVGKGGGAFCIRKNCSVISHEDVKIPFQGKNDSCYFICRGGEGSTVIYSQPSIEEQFVPMKTKEEWETQQKTLAEWRLAFKAVENSDDAEATSDDITKEVTFLNETSTFRTPSKKRKDVMMSSDDGETLGNIEFVGHVRTLPEDLTKELDEVIVNTMAKGLLTRIVARLESSMMTQGSALEAVADLTYKRFLSNERDLRVVSGAVQNVQTLVGPPVELDARFDAPTLWGATSFVAEEVGRVTGNVKALEGGLAPIKEDIKALQSQVAQDANVEKSEKMLKVLVMMSAKMKEASSEIVALKSKVKSLETVITASSTHDSIKRVKVAEPADEMDELMDMFGTSHVATSVRPRIPDTGENEISQNGEEFTSKIRNIMEDLKQLSEDVGLLKAGSEDKSVKFAGLGWRSILDCQEWIKINFPSNRYGLIMDPLLMLDRVFGSDDVEADSQFKTLESRVKLKIATGAEAAAIKALYFKRPRLFHSGQVSMATDRNKSKLNKLADHKVWKSGGEGVHNHIIQRLNLLHLTISQDITHVLGRDPKGQLLATMCLNATVTFLTQMLAFVDSIYEKLVVASKFTAEQGWSLTMKILDRICEDLFAPKEGVVVAMNVEEPGSICAHVLWSCFRTHDIMAMYMDVNFENHPAISAEYVKFLATNSGFDKVEKLEVAMTGFKVQVEKASSEASKARSIADGAASSASTATKAVAELSKRVVKLESK
ncbi:hypothetical protein MHU86_15499 [Fragilaria crotonensis]|nr:hypothetical protein MHU86_15499 [Fragilaria crotonensis]